MSYKYLNFNVFFTITLIALLAGCGGKKDEPGNGQPQKVSIDLGTINVPSTVISDPQTPQDFAAIQAQDERYEREATCLNRINTLTASARPLGESPSEITRGSGTGTSDWELEETIYYRADGNRHSVLARANFVTTATPVTVTPTVECLNPGDATYNASVEFLAPFRIRQNDNVILSYFERRFWFERDLSIADRSGIETSAVFPANSASSSPRTQSWQNVNAPAFSFMYYVLPDGKLLKVETYYQSTMIERKASIYRAVAPVVTPAPQPETPVTPEPEAPSEPQPPAPDTSACDSAIPNLILGATELPGNEVQSTLRRNGRAIWRLKSVVSHRRNDFQASSHRSQVAISHHGATQPNGQFSIEANAGVECLRQGYVMGLYRISMQDPLPYEIRRSDLVVSSEFLYSFESNENREVLNTSTQVGLNPLQSVNQGLTTYLQNTSSRDVKVFRTTNNRIVILVTYQAIANGQSNTLQVAGDYELVEATAVAAPVRPRRNAPAPTRPRNQTRHRR